MSEENKDAVDGSSDDGNIADDHHAQGRTAGSKPDADDKDSNIKDSNNKDASDTNAVSDSTQQATVEQQQSEAAAAADAETKSTTTPAKRKRRIPWGVLLLTLLLLATMAAVAYIGWYGYQYLQTDQRGSTEVQALQQQLQTQLQHQAQQLAALKQSRSEEVGQARQQTRDLQERVQVLEQRVIAQNKRLLAMSTITREDWLLAEAEYLLKLANQRILIEHSATGAESLLSEVDNILRDLDDPDLFPLRKAVKNDLAALRLVQKIDVEGIYLDIDGLINQLPALPIKPTRQEVMVADGQSQADEPAADQPDATGFDAWLTTFARSFQHFTQALGQYIRVRDHSVEAKALLAPDTAQYLMHNVRLILERAQLALLREQPKIYQQSLQQAQNYITRFYPESNAAILYNEQLRVLSQKNIVTSLPDISPSLELLHSYIEQLHQLKGAKPAGQEAR